MWIPVRGSSSPGTAVNLSAGIGGEISVLLVAGSGNKPGPRRHLVYGSIMASNAPFPSAPPSRASGAALHGRGARLWALVRGHPVRSGAVLGALLLIVVAGAPLATRAWEAFWSLPHAGRVVLCALGLAVIIAATARRWHGQRQQWRGRAGQARLGALIAVAWAVVVVAVVVLVAGAWWVMGAPTSDFPDALPPRALDTLVTRAFAIVAALGAAALLVISYRRQLTTETGAEREVAKLFTDTFDSASDKLGSDHAAVRLAGVHALARLADEAPEGREDLVQMVIDVLCAYLRMPYTPAPEPLAKKATDDQAKEHHQQHLEFASLREVRHTIIRVIGNRLRDPTRWRGKDYDFTGTVFDGGDLYEAHFTGGTVDFSHARFADGAVNFSHTQFTGGVVSFYRAEFAGAVVAFNAAKFADGLVTFDRALFFHGTVFFGAAKGARPGGLLRAIEEGAPDVVAGLPDAWQADARKEEKVLSALQDTEEPPPSFR